MSESKICLLCGTHFPETEDPSVCPICEDERGLGCVPPEGQPFTTLEAFRSSHPCVVREEGPSAWVTRPDPAMIPLSASAVARVAMSVEPFVFDRIYGGWFWTRTERDAKDVFARSVRRYLHTLEA